MSAGVNPTLTPSGTGTTPPSPGSGSPSSTTPATGGSSGGTPAPDFVVYEKSFTSDPNWPADLVLNHVKSNWYEWDRRIHFIADQRGFGAYLRGTFPKPDASIHPRASLSWDVNNLALRGFIIEHISDSDYDIVSSLDNAHDVYTKLRSRHQNEGLYAQIKVISDALGTRFVPGTPLSQTVDQMKRLHSRFIKMGCIDDDKLLTILLFNALRDHYTRLQTSINDMFTSGSTTSADVCNRLLLRNKPSTTTPLFSHLLHSRLSLRNHPAQCARTASAPLTARNFASVPVAKWLGRQLKKLVLHKMLPVTPKSLVELADRVAIRPRPPPLRRTTQMRKHLQSTANATYLCHRQSTQQLHLLLHPSTPAMHSQRSPCPRTMRRSIWLLLPL